MAITRWSIVVTGMKAHMLTSDSRSVIAPSPMTIVTIVTIATTIIPMTIVVAAFVRTMTIVMLRCVSIVIAMRTLVT
jgi:hypothetical protein